MRIRHLIKKTINGLLVPFGYEVVRSQNLVTLNAAFQRQSKRDIPIHTIIDVGASNGQWTDSAKPFFPNAFCYLIEANPYHLGSLEAYKKRHNKMDFVLAAAGHEVGETSFDGKTPEGGSAYQGRHREGDLRVPMTTLDYEVATKHLQPPFLLKLDTHGFEVSILSGASEMLKDTNVIVVEVYNFQLRDGSLKFSEMIDFLDERGFHPVDLCDPSFRPSDHAFWQMDLFFIRSDRKEFLCNTYTSTTISK